MDETKYVVNFEMLRSLKNSPQEGDLSVWWIPQIPGKPFRVMVPDITTAALLMDAFAKYDLFCLAENVRSDYSNAGGLDIFEDGEWSTWYDEELGGDIDEVLDEVNDDEQD